MLIHVIGNRWRIDFCAAHKNFSRANWRKRNKTRALSKREAVTASCWRWRNAVISVIILHFSLRPHSSIPPARFVLSKLLAAMLKSGTISLFSLTPFLLLLFLFQAYRALIVSGFVRFPRRFSRVRQLLLVKKEKNITRGSIYRHAVHEDRLQK